MLSEPHRNKNLLLFPALRIREILLLLFYADAERQNGEIFMKKLVSAVLAALVSVSSLAVFADSSEILINGEKAVIGEGMGSVVTKQDRTFVPVRFVLEYFGYNVTWNDDDRLVFGRNNDGDIFIMQVGSKKLFFNRADGTSKNIEMDVEPFLNEDESRTYIPLRFLAEVLGYNVDYNGSTDTVTLDKK